MEGCAAEGETIELWSVVVITMAWGDVRILFYYYEFVSVMFSVLCGIMAVVPWDIV